MAASRSLVSIEASLRPVSKLLKTVVTASISLLDNSSTLAALGLEDVVEAVHDMFIGTDSPELVRGWSLTPTLLITTTKTEIMLEIVLFLF